MGSGTEVVLFSEVTNVLSLDRGCPLRGNKCTITMGSGTEVVLFSEVTNVLSLWEVGQRLSSSQR